MIAGKEKYSNILSINEQDRVLWFLANLEAGKIDGSNYLRELRPVYEILHQHGARVALTLRDCITADSSLRHDSSKEALERADVTQAINSIGEAQVSDALKPLEHIADSVYCAMKAEERYNGSEKNQARGKQEYGALIRECIPLLSSLLSIHINCYIERTESERKHNV